VALEEHDAPSPALAETPSEPVINSDRQALMDGPELPIQAQQDHHPNLRERKKFKSKVKTNPYKKQSSFAQKQKEEADQRQAEREENHKQWEQKKRDREKFQAMVRKAKRPTVDGKRKLGRESGVLLEKGRRMVEG
jgi:DNA polymerase III gamma/tau subunit